MALTHLCCSAKSSRTADLLTGDEGMLPPSTSIIFILACDNVIMHHGVFFPSATEHALCMPLRREGGPVHAPECPASDTSNCSSCAISCDRMCQMYFAHSPWNHERSCQVNTVPGRLSELTRRSQRNNAIRNKTSLDIDKHVLCILRSFFRNWESAKELGSLFRCR